MKLLDKILNILLPKEDDSHEFKPILAEIEDTPLNPIGNTMFWIKHRRLILWVLYALFFLHAYLWYALGYQRVGQFGFGEIFKYFYGLSIA